MTIKLYRILLILFSAINCFAQNDTTFSVKYFTTRSDLSIRALEVRSDSKVWFAANHGVWGFTEDAGKTWHIDSIKVDSVYPEFRSIAVLNDSTVLLLSIASPAYLFKTTNKGKTWKLVYKNTNKNIFFDSMKFVDETKGIAVADPIDGEFLFIKTIDGGEKWSLSDYIMTAHSLNEESFFATSNTNISYSEPSFWFATGGKNARVLKTGSFKGRPTELEAYNVPIVQGEKMTGIFSIDFFDDSIGVIAGGNYEKTDTSIVSLATTKDGGKTWKAIKNKKPFFGSCVQFKSADTFFVTGHDGTFTCNYKTGIIQEIKDKSGSQLKFHTLRFSSSGKSAWFAGDKGRIAFITFAP